MNKEQLVSHMASLGHLPTKKATRQFIEDLFAAITENVEKGNDVRISGFGKFEKYTRTNGETTPKFRPFLALRTKVA